MEDAITIDAHIFNYFICFLETEGEVCHSPRMLEFTDIINQQNIAVNEFILAEFRNCADSNQAKHWIKIKTAESKLIQVDPISFQRHIKVTLRDEYGFDITNSDMKYLETSLNTCEKRLITHNHIHFRRPHRSGRRRTSMDNYLRRELEINIHNIEEFCDIYRTHHPDPVFEREA